MDIIFRPMPEEPSYKPLPKDCKPNATYNRTFALLRHELKKAGAERVVIEAGFTDNNIRIDGWPYSNAKPNHSTVRISFSKGKIPLVFTCGGHRDWVQNVYLIGMTLERLRAIERYGCIQGDEQYRGFSALPPGVSSIAAAEWASVDAARWFLADMAVLPPGSDLQRLYRECALIAHPDRQGGSTELMAKVNRARDFIEKAEA